MLLIKVAKVKVSGSILNQTARLFMNIDCKKMIKQNLQCNCSPEQLRKSLGATVYASKHSSKL